MKSFCFGEVRAIMSVQCVVLAVYSVFPRGGISNPEWEENALSCNSYRMQGVNHVKSRQKGEGRHEIEGR